MTESERRAARALRLYRCRLAAYQTGDVQPDPRDDDLVDRGLNIEWRVRMRRREMRRTTAERALPAFLQRKALADVRS